MLLPYCDQFELIWSFEGSLDCMTSNYIGHLHMRTYFMDGQLHWLLDNSHYFTRKLHILHAGIVNESIRLFVHKEDGVVPK